MVVDHEHRSNVCFQTEDSPYSWVILDFGERSVDCRVLIKTQFSLCLDTMVLRSLCLRRTNPWPLRPELCRDQGDCSADPPS